MKVSLKKGDIFLVFLLLVVVGIFFLLTNMAEVGDIVIVTTRTGEHQYSLQEDQNILLENPSHGRNEIVIKNGEVYMLKATCPDKICVKHKPISKNGEMIICLPNEVYVCVQSKEEREIDN